VIDVDSAALYVALRKRRRERRITFATVAKEAGVSNSTITRIGYGNRPSVEGYLRLVVWLGHDLPPYAISTSSPGEAS
jgi:transcriptional regulator with XRE-family HTH domain